MDIVSLNKANQALKRIKHLDQDIIGAGAESHFKSVDARLDWIENQALVQSAANTLNIDLSKGTFNNTELINNKLQLKKIGETQAGYTENVIPAKLSFDDLSKYPWKITGTGFLKFRSPDRMFDHGASAFAGGTNGPGSGYILFDTGEGYETQITKIRLTSAGYGFPQNWKIDTSDENNFSGEEKTVYQNTDESYKNKGQILEVNLSTDRPYRYYKMTYKSTYGDYAPIGQPGNHLSLYELEAMAPKTVTIYASQGSYETEKIDFGIGYIKTDLINIVQQLPSSDAKVETYIADSADGENFSDYVLLDLENLPQNRYIKIKLSLSALALSEDPTSATETPTVSSVTIDIIEQSLEGRLKNLELSNAINLAKLNFRTSAYALTDKYQLEEMVIDTFEQSGSVDPATTASYDETNKQYIGAGDMLTVTDTLAYPPTGFLIVADSDKATFQYSLDNGATWVDAPTNQFINITTTNTQLKIKATIEEGGALRALAYSWI